MANDVPPMRRNFERGVNAAVFFAPDARNNAVAIGELLNRADAVRKKIDANHEKMRPAWERKEYERLRKEYAQTPSLRMPAPRPSFGGSAEYIGLWFKSVGHETWFYWYITICIALSLLVYAGMRDTRDTSRMNHDE